MTLYQTSKVVIPHPKEKDVHFTGTLEHVTNLPAASRRLALIVHGVLGHKDYLYQKRLARRLPIHSFRFDFRGNHESTGQPQSIRADATDIQIIYDYVTKQLGYIVEVIIAHSRGSISSLLWMCSSPDAEHVKGFINVSGRCRLQATYAPLSEEQRVMLATKGYYYMRASVLGKQTTIKIDGSDHAIDMLEALTRFPSTTHVLTLQGLADKIVRPYDATLFARALSSRTPGTHSLCFIENADHNYTTYTEALITTILDWLDALESLRLVTGLWHESTRANL